MSPSPHRSSPQRVQRAASPPRKPKRHTPSPPPSSNLDAGGVSHYFDNDDRDSTRTLFVGNLDNDIEREFLKHLFSRHGIVEEVDIKRNFSMGHTQKSSSNVSSSKTYAFVRFQNMDMAIEAKNKMNGKRLNGRNECKIGYGKILFAVKFAFFGPFLFI